MVGNNVSHANNKKKCRFLPNLRPVTLYSTVLNRDVSLRITARGLKTIFKYGGLDPYLQTVPKRRLEGILLVLRRELDRKKPA